MADDDEETVMATGSPFEVMNIAADTEVGRMVGYFSEDQAQVVFTVFRAIDSMMHIATNLAKLQVSEGGDREVADDDDQLNKVKALFVAYMSMHVLEAVHQWYNVAGKPDLCDGFGTAMIVMPQIGLDGRDGGDDDD